ncbi:MAG TPA: galactose oxidase-like domain-containing protein [Thermoanaerobaculia bacterium]|nr:galactose oxidase-like domain-containing protein [Thermoanaerobaculia bacterium]
MKNRHRGPSALLLGMLSWAPLTGSTAAFAQGSDCTDRSVCGEVSPLIPMQSTEAIHMGLVWKRDSQTPKILFHARFPEYTPNDVADPAVVDAALAAGALTNGVNDFNPSLRDVLHPAKRDGSDPHADSFQRLTYGGYLLRQGLSQSVPTRIVANRTMERQLLFDIGHPDAFKNNGKFHTALLDEEDFALNRAAFTEVGSSRGMFYNTYCNARVTLADGRVYVFGGHDMQSQNGLYKVNIFDPETETWAPRAKPCTLDNWHRDPFGAQLFAQDPEAQNYPGCDQRDVRSTQPPDPSDMKYARWYPSAVALPDGRVLILAGTDQDASVGPDPQAEEKGLQGIVQTDAAFSATRVTQVVPEVYDPQTDRTIALENARKTFPLYPQAEVVQTGPDEDDWVVCTMGGMDRVRNPVPPGGDRFFGPFSKQTWCLDVLAALKDPKREVAAENHWTFSAEAQVNRHYCCPTASLVKTDRSGKTRSHRWLMISGRTDSAAIVSTIEEMELTAKSPKWRKAGDLIHPSVTSKAVVLPDGKVLIGQGTFAQGATFDERAGLRFQLYDPARGTTRGLAKTTVVRGLHGTATLLPDATVFFAGENREALIRTDDPSFPLGGFPKGDPDLGVPNGQIFRPPYLFKKDGSPAERPVIATAPEVIHYDEHFEISVQGRSDRIASVVIIRSDHNTHSFTGGDRFVDLGFEIHGNPDQGGLRIFTPRLPAQAVPGIYMLFVVDSQGVPSVAKRVLLMHD